MSPCRLSVAVTFCLVWYFSDSGQTAVQYLICVLCCLITPLFGKNGRESSTQTEEEPKEHPLQETAKEDVFDGPDEGSLEKNTPPISKYSHARKSLQQVFECAYAQLVLPWLGVPEPLEHQPLHGVLSREFDLVIDRIINRSRDFDVCRAVVGSIRILTQHLHNARQPDRELLLSTPAVEMTVLRELSDALVRNLFPPSFWGQEISHCALKEILALKGLKLVVRWLSDPDNLNQLVVNQLDGVTLESSAEEPPVSDPNQTSLDSRGGDGGDREGSEVSVPEISPDADIGSKRKGSRLKEGWFKFMDKVKSKKAKKKKMKTKEHELLVRMTQGDKKKDVGSREGSLLDQDESERDDSDLEDYLASVQEELIEFKLSYEMWRVGNWTISIPHADWVDEELVFTVHLEEKDSPENLQWDIKKTYMDVFYFRNRWQHSTCLPTICDMKESDVGDEVKEEVRKSVEHFLQKLVSDETFGPTQPVFQFLCPLEKLLNEEEHHGVWGLLSGLACFLSPVQEEEENLNSQTEVPKENARPASAEGSRDIPGAPLPTIVVSQYNSPTQLPKEAGMNSDPKPSVNSSHENRPQDKPEDSDKTLTAHFKTFIRGVTRSRSQESLVSPRSSVDEEQLDEREGLQQEGTEGRSLVNPSIKLNKKEKTGPKMSTGANKAKGKETSGAPLRGEESQQGQGNWEQLEATKAIFELLKEISGNSILINIFDAILKPVMPILKKKINTFLNKLNPTEETMAAHVDTMRRKLWPEIQQAAPPPTPPPRTAEEKKETRERAHDLINTRYSNFLILKKTDVESVFNIFQNSEENQSLVYTLLSFLLGQFLPNEHSLAVSAAILQKATSSCNGSVKP
ncbi:uncharacterized protein si:rp71-46j2.7 isoform X1 [Nothobranchius furzeri]|uniref:LOC107378478-like protein n=2 Tax=Nothobranchius TaxID=28779 RepID=A0A9D3C465_NOTFU|nr:putative LOC107378478-like protein [Nothobranchius furzeri]